MKHYSVLSRAVVLFLLLSALSCREQRRDEAPQPQQLTVAEAKDWFEKEFMTSPAGRQTGENRKEAFWQYARPVNNHMVQVPVRYAQKKGISSAGLHRMYVSKNEQGKLTTRLVQVVLSSKYTAKKYLGKDAVRPTAAELEGLVRVKDWQDNLQKSYYLHNGRRIELFEQAANGAQRSGRVAGGCYDVIVRFEQWNYIGATGNWEVMHLLSFPGTYCNEGSPTVSEPSGGLTEEANMGQAVQSAIEQTVKNPPAGGSGSGPIPGNGGGYAYAPGSQTPLSVSAEQDSDGFLTLDNYGNCISGCERQFVSVALEGEVLAKAQIDLLLSQAEITNFINALKNASKKGVASAITTSADFAHKLYSKLGAITKNYPQLIPYTNTALIPLKAAVKTVTDENEPKMGWVDLTNVWLFEIGKPVYTFKDAARTTADLMTQEGVQQARQKAIDKIKAKDLSPVSHGWKYGQSEFYQGIKEGNVPTSFLGSYNTNVSIKDNGNGTYTLTYTVRNTTGWESGTRLRKDNDGNGTHDAVIPDKPRNDNRGPNDKETIGLGGNLDQTWTWSETVNK